MLPDENIVTVDTERFRRVETLFRPVSLARWFHDTSFQIIMKCDASPVSGSITWSTILSVTVCTGGSTAPSRCLKRSARSSLCQNSFKWCWTYDSHLPLGPVSGSEEAVLLAGWLVCVGEQTDEGFMGARRSTGRVSARWFLFPTHTWEPLLLTRVV